MRIDEDTQKEYGPLLQQLYDEQTMLEASVAASTKRVDEIKGQVKEIADVTGGKQRVVMPIPDRGKAYDRRQVKKRNSGEVDETLLEEIIGDVRWRKLCSTVYVFDPMKFKKARVQGHITDAHIAAATKPLEYNYTLGVIADKGEEEDD